MRIVIGIALVGITLVLWLSSRGASDPERAVEGVGASSAVPSTTAGSPRPSASVAAAVPSRMPPPSPSLPPAKGMKAQFKERVALLDPAIARCLALAHQRLTGDAVLDFVAGRDPATGLVVVETTGIVDEGTTLEDEPVLACLHEAARGLPPFQLPEGIETAYAAWRLELDDGEVKARRLTEYSLRKLTDGPFD